MPANVRRIVAVAMIAWAGLAGVDGHAQNVPADLARAQSPEVVAAREALRLARAQFPVGHPRLFPMLRDLGTALLNDGRYAEAERVFREQLALAEARFPGETLAMAGVMFNLGEVYRRSDRCAQAEPLQRRSLAIREKIRGDDAAGAGWAALRLAQCLQSLARFPEAETNYKRSLDLFESRTGPDSPSVAEAAARLGNFYSQTGKFVPAEALLTRALAIREKINPPNDRLIAGTLTQLSRLYRRLDRLAEAERAVRRGLELRERALGPNHQELADSLLEIGEVMSVQGRFREAESSVRRAVRLMEATLGPDNPSVADGLGLLGDILRGQGRFADAIPLIERQLAVDERALGPDHPRTASALINLGSVLRWAGRLNDAAPRFARGLAIREKVFGAESGLLTAPLINLALIEMWRRRHREADALLLRSIAIQEKTRGAESAGLASSLDILALNYLNENRAAEADAPARRALAIRERIFGPDHLQVAWSLSRAALAAEGNDRPDDALAMARRMTAIFRARAQRDPQDRVDPASSEQRTARGFLLDHVRILSNGYERGGPGRDAAAAEAFEVVQLAQATGTDAAVALMAARFASGTDELAGVVRAREDALAHWVALDGRLLRLAAQADGPSDAREEARTRAELARLDARLRELDRRLAREFPEYAALAAPEPATLAEVQALLKPEEALLTYAVGIRHTFAIALRADRVTFHRFDIGREGIVRAVQALRRTLDPANVTSLDDVKPFEAGRALQLYRQIFAPVEATLEGARTVYAVADGGLQSLPFGVLVTQAPAAPLRDFAAHADVAWLARRYAFTMLPSAGALKSLRRFARATRAPEPFLGIGNPSLDGQPGTARGMRAAALVSRGGVADANEVRKLAPLPETVEELTAMAKALGAGEASFLLGADAREGEVRKRDLSRYRIVAFATHGLMAGEFADMGEPALVLTPPRQGTAADDGLLTASEIAKLKLDADWVILSACNTAAADGTPGAEGLSGLARAFFYAGTRALFVSHWAVQSDATVKLTTAMLSALAADPTLGRAEAHRRAMLALMADKVHAAYAHPMFWAPFVVVGESG